MKHQEYVKVGPLYKLTIGGQRFYPFRTKTYWFKSHLIISVHRYDSNSTTNLQGCRLCFGKPKIAVLVSFEQMGIL